MNVYSEQLVYFTFACLNLEADERPTAAECFEASYAVHHKFEKLLKNYKKTA